MINETKKLTDLDGSVASAISVNPDYKVIQVAISGRSTGVIDVLIVHKGSSTPRHLSPPVSIDLSHQDSAVVSGFAASSVVLSPREAGDNYDATVTQWPVQGGFMGLPTRKYASLSSPRVLTTEVNQAEIATIEGDRFSAQKIFSNVDSTVPLYALFENPIDSGVIVGLQKRNLKSLSSGLQSVQVLWDYDVSNAAKVMIPCFNENNVFRGIKDCKFQVSLLNGVTAPVSAGDWNINAAANIDSDGIERESDFIPTSGTGNNSSGSVSPELGFRLYAPGTGFLIKIVSDGDNNRVLLGYDWIEVPTGLI